MYNLDIDHKKEGVLKLLALRVIMAVREILQVGDKTLKRVSKKVECIDDEIKDIIEDLKDTLYAGTGIGLAAPQIGYLKRIFIIDLRNGQETIILINPKFLKRIGKEESQEGCLSYPGYEGIVIRPRRVVIMGLNEKGKEVTYEATGLLKDAFCHEYDHLDGIVYIDKAKKVYKVEQIE
ncbi:peptide deformylase [Clostridium botulinum]|uniref:Peptide deformylase n=1 Tax=Clostridium botulinum TaxID=1491 RepID=A0ABC8CNU8_CLOBO|nr:peptide deformylase [Clostridium botulinum]AVQ37258.1 peptide deformylase [Clostridium botulinum]